MNPKPLLLSLTSLAFAVAGLCAQTPQNPILFVTQVPQPSDFTTVLSTFGNHLSSVNSAPRGGDLYIRYPDGTLKNLTATAGYGSTDSEGFQGATSIAVRDPHVHWDGTKAIFSMVIGAPSKRYEQNTYYWQMYEITGLGLEETPVIAKVPNQPEDYNNVSPIYGTDGRIIFTTDRPRDGLRHTYPQLDEYEEAPTNTGLWSLDPATGDLFLMDHAPSGDFTPIIDSFGRVIFTRWDHMQRDQQADGDALEELDPEFDGYSTHGTFDYTDESPEALIQFGIREEYYPEPRPVRTDLLAGTNLTGHRFNLFFPWMIEEDGTEMETLNHIGRHELHTYFERSLTDDPNLDNFTPGGRTNQNPLRNIFQMREDPTDPGLYIGTDAPEFATHASGQIIAIEGAPDDNPDDMLVHYLTHPDTRNFTASPSAEHSGLYRDPLPTSDGLLIASHTAETNQDANIGTGGELVSRYDFRIKTLVLEEGEDYREPGVNLTNGISKTVSFWSPDNLITYDGELWEVQPVEVKATPIPNRDPIVLGAPETGIFNTEGVNIEAFQRFMSDYNLALIVMRDVTTRDANDEQQPYNLQVAGGGASTIGSPGTIYDVKYLQLFQADLLRGINMHTAASTPAAGRRILARPMHDDHGINPELPLAPEGGVEIASDGSVVAFVPARRALSWQLTDSAGEGVVRERFWLTFQPGEIRSCTSCHGLNKTDQVGNTTPQNPPEALAAILEAWKDLVTVDARIINLVMDGSGVYHFDIEGAAGLELTLERSSNLVDWEDVGDYQIPALPPHTLNIQDALGNTDRCFYRLRKNI